MSNAAELNQKINEKINELKSKISPEEYQQYLQFQHAMASKHVCKYIKYLLDNHSDSNADPNMKNKILNYIDKIQPSNTVGYQELEFKTIKELDENDIRFRISLVKVRKDHRLELCLPNEPTLVKEIMMRINNHAKLAMSFYNLNFVGNPEIFNCLSEVLSDIDCSKLQIDVGDRTMYLDPNINYRIGVSALFYKDNKEYDINQLVD